MISTLHIKNIGIIDDLSINLNNGLNIFRRELVVNKVMISLFISEFVLCDKANLVFQ